MNKSNILNIILAISLVVISIKAAYFSYQEKSSEACEERTTENAILNNILTRTSIRDYENKQIDECKIDSLLQAAMSAPTARNQQPWKFVVINDKEILKTISEQFKSMRMAEKAPIAIVVCGDLDLALDGEGRDYWVQDASAATENLLLAAHSMGLGAVWCGIYPIQERVDTLSKLLNLPDNIVPLNVIPIGYPAENPNPKDKWKPENVRYNTWLEKE
jgi:nitroreductase